MKILILSPSWNLPWLDMLPKRLLQDGHDVYLREQPPEHMKYDVAVHMWGVGTTPGDYAKRNIMFFRSYDFYFNDLKEVLWDKIDHVVNVNAWMYDELKRFVKHKHSLVYNYIDHSKFKYADRKHGNKIGMACHVHHKKNLPLALQILLCLPKEYELHIAGEIQTPDIEPYIDCIAKEWKRKVYLYGHIPSEQMDLWWEDKDYCLSTSLREGNPNNVIEAMSKGIKPVVHAWPGAKEQFGDVFCSVEDAALDIMQGEYDSAKYRSIAEDRFGNKNLEEVVNIITGG